MAITAVTSGELEISDATAGSTTRTLNFALGSRTNGLLQVVVTLRSASGLTAISATYNGVSLSVDVSLIDGGSPAASYAQLSLPVGSGDASAHDLVVTFAGINTAAPLQGQIVYSTWDGAAQSSYVDNTNTSSGTSATPAVSLTPSQDNCLIIANLKSEANAISSWGKTLLQDFDGGAWVAGAEYTIQTTAGAESMGVTISPSDTYLMSAVAYRAAGGAFNPAAFPWSTPASPISAREIVGY